jgi:hypothetical protein
MPIREWSEDDWSRNSIGSRVQDLRRKVIRSDWEK